MYRDLSNVELEARLRGLVERIGPGPVDMGDPGVRKLVDEAYRIRQEIERRGGWRKPNAGVNFESYVTD